MKQIIPFSKDIAFKTMIGDIASISLDHTLNILKDNSIKGDFIISGSYKMTEASTIEEEFSYKIPVDIYIDKEYDLKDAKVDIDDFNYNIVNDDTLSVKIDLLLDNIEVKEEKVLEKKEEILEKEFLSLQKDIEKEVLKNEREEDEDIEEVVEIPVEVSNDNNTYKVESIFNKFSDEEDSYATYKVYIVRANDTIDSIIEKYNITLDELKEYNDIDDIKLNDKLIIPSSNEAA